MNEPLAKFVLAQLRAELARRDITRMELASRLNVSDAWMYRRLNGSVTLDLNDLELIAQALEMDPLKLLERAA